MDTDAADAREDGALAELRLLLRPAGAGLHTVSTGRDAQLALQRALYGVSDAAAITPAWHATLAAVRTARVAVLGIPSDCGAGLVRGASYGPQALRAFLLESRPDHRSWAASAGIVDVGDVAVVPHLLHDDMLSEAQKRASRAALFAGAAGTADFPVAPLSIAERALERLFDLNPRLKIFVLGGDHSVAYPAVAVLKRRRATALGVVQPDAHTDLLPERLGVRICFATWAYHANDLLGRGGRLVQIGVRASGRPRAHWEETLGVKQFWAAELAGQSVDTVVERVVSHLREANVQQVYFSNDIDATDAPLAPATGAPEPGGLTPDLLLALVRGLGRAFELVGADLVEVAPPVGAPEDSRRTVALGATYVRACLEALVAERAS